MRKFFRWLKQNRLNAFGVRLPMRVLIIESDDWGAIRTPSKEVLNSIRRKGFSIDKSIFNRLDCLETNNDLSGLLNVLTSFRNSARQSPKVTLNTIVANPDFKVIKASGYHSYSYESLPRTLSRYPDRENVFTLYRIGQEESVFRNQFHGREHLHIRRWMNAIANTSNPARILFDYETTYSGTADYSFMEAFDIDSEEDSKSHPEIITTGLNLFQQYFGFRPASFIAPCNIWPDSIEPILKSQGIRFLQSDIYRLLPLGGRDNYRKLQSRLGEKKPSGLVQLRRNCTFEPCLPSKSDWVDHALAGIAAAFRWGKPAVICSHRVNYIGSLSEANRDHGLNELRRLLAGILKNWPDVTFMFSDELGSLFEE
jgi:hypothetical protein